MKYEMIFGDERLADKFTNDSSVFIVCRGHGVYFEFESGNDGVNYIANSCSIGDSFYMRRIIKEPKRWTVADQKAGRLPEVGSNAEYFANNEHDDTEITSQWRSGDELEILRCQNKNKAFVVFNKRTEQSSNLIINCMRPIETPAEKARRERDEWAKKASEFIDDELDCVNLVGEHVMRRFYNAMLSGELPMPKKGGE